MLYEGQGKVKKKNRANTNIIVVASIRMAPIDPYI